MPEYLGSPELVYVPIFPHFHESPDLGTPEFSECPYCFEFPSIWTFSWPPTFAMLLRGPRWGTAGFVYSKKIDVVRCVVP